MDLLLAGAALALDQFPPALAADIAANWTWVSGSNTIESSGTYGTKGTVAVGNVPGARHIAVSWTDASGNFWLFGGFGRDSAGLVGHLNDLWKWDGTNWTWVSGSNIRNSSGTYGTKGTAAAANVPGARHRAVSWMDASGNFWLFGGGGYDSTGAIGHMNDLWKWDGTNWAWVSGSNTRNSYVTYGIKGTAAAANVPGARDRAVSWMDASGNFWLFGGQGYGSGQTGNLNDLWKWDGTNWTWVSGSILVNSRGTYGIKGAAEAANVPGARWEAVSWTDASGNFWLFGGNGNDSDSFTGELNDLWKWDGTNWTWVSGSNTRNSTGTYGTKGTAAATNVPGGRRRGVSWTDSSGNLWLFGGGGYSNYYSVGKLNDLWKFGY